MNPLTLYVANRALVLTHDEVAFLAEQLRTAVTRPQAALHHRHHGRGNGAIRIERAPSRATGDSDLALTDC